MFKQTPNIWPGFTLAPHAISCSTAEIFIRLRRFTDEANSERTFMCLKAVSDFSASSGQSEIKFSMSSIDSKLLFFNRPFEEENSFTNSLATIPICEKSKNLFFAKKLSAKSFKTNCVFSFVFLFK